MSKPLYSCPFCGDKNPELGILEEEGDVITRYDACPECDGTWRQEFRFTDWSVVLHPENLEVPTQEQEAPGTVLHFGAFRR